MNDRGIDPRLLEVLQHASNLQLFQLNSVIERMLADPKRIVQVRKDLHMGQTLRFMDWRDGQMRLGKIVAMKDTQLTVQEDGTRSAWTLPYTAVEPPAPGAARPATSPHAAAGRGWTVRRGHFRPRRPECAPVCHWNASQHPRQQPWLPVVGAAVLAVGQGDEDVLVFRL